MRAREVFPEPFGPSTAQCWPDSMVHSTSWRISTPSRRKDPTSMRATFTGREPTTGRAFPVGCGSVQVAAEGLQPLCHQRAQPRQIEGLLHPRILYLIEEGVGARGESAAGEEDGATRLLGSFDRERRVEVHAGHARHHQVAEDEVEALALANALQRLFRRGEIDHFVRRQRLLEEAADARLAADREDAGAPAGGRGQAAEAGRLRTAGPDGKLYREGRPAPGDAFHRDGAAHRLHDLAAD